jgi:membrane-bound lytic murein transglycosylase D
VAFAGCASSHHRPPGTEPEPPLPAPAGAEAPVADAAASEHEITPGPVEGPVESTDEAAGPDELAPGEVVTESPLDELGIAEPVLGPESADIERLVVEDPGPPAFDLPIEINDKVLAWVEHYSKQRSSLFSQSLVRSGRYLEMIRTIFQEEGVPVDLGYMAHVESAYKTTAYSRAHAKGIFQFISSTGTHYGLRIDYWEDQRSDPEKSTRAAAAYLNKLYDEFGDWYLALAAYNAGEGKIRRGLARTGAKDFWRLAQTRYIRLETRNYVPAILAAILIAKDPERYGFEFTPDPPVLYDTIDVEDAVDLRVLAECAGTDLETMKLLNPALRRQQTPPGRTTEVRVPVGTGSATLAELAEVPKDKRILYAHHVVKRGDTLWQISQAYHVSIGAIQTANGMGRRTLLRPGQALKIPTSGSSPSYASADVRFGETVVYKVQRGDTLERIARRFDATPAAIASANSMRLSDTIYVGQKLTIVSGAGYGARSTATDGEEQATHTVRRGDTLWGIAKTYRSSVAELCALNSISPRATLLPGTKLTVPTR